MACLLLALTTGLLGVSATAQVPCENQKIVMEADQPLDIDTRNNTAVFRDVVITQCATRIEGEEANVKGGPNFENGELTLSGNVRITAEGGNLQSDKAVVSFQNNVIARATITGSPVVFEQQRADGTTWRGRAGTMSYDTASGLVGLQQDAWLSDGCTEITGQQLGYNVREQRVQPQSKSGAAGRIVFTFQPKGESGNACSRPGTEKKP